MDKSKMVSFIYSIRRSNKEELGYVNEPLVEAHDTKVLCTNYFKRVHNKRIYPILKTLKEKNFIKLIK